MTSSPNSPHTPQPLPPQDSRLRNGVVAIVAVILTVAVVLGLRGQTQFASLDNLVADSVPLDEALGNGQPTLLEFYADWCVSCQTMAPGLGDLHEQYGDRVNFAMLNVDNDKWLPELLAYRVDGIPHFVYLDSQGQPVAQAIGEQPQEIMAANLEALVNNQALPYAKSLGTLSPLGDRPFLNSLDSVTPGDSTTPRSHGPG